MGRSSSGSEVVIMDDRVLEAATRVGIPPVQNLSVTKSSRVHIGPKFVSVTQNVDNIEVVKDLPLPRYLWNVAKSTTKAERLSCAAALIFLITCIILIVYFIVFAKNIDLEDPDEGAPREWFITRKMWLAPPFTSLSKTTDEFQPLRLVIIGHTASSDCNRYANCAAQLRNLQLWFMRFKNDDIPYNFLIDSKGRVYEARGWNVVGAHVKGYNDCILAVAFIGDYREGLPAYSKVNEIQLERVQMLFKQGIELGHLHPQFQVLGTRDLRDTISPGDNLYNAIQQWDNFAHDNVFRDRSCKEIHAMFDGNKTIATSGG